MSPQPICVPQRWAASPEPIDSALQALEDQGDVRAGAEARNEEGRVPHEELLRELDR